MFLGMVSPDSKASGSRSSMYEERLCAFVDILGFRELVQRSLNRPVLQQKIRQLLREVVEATPVWERNSPVDLIEARLSGEGARDPKSAAEKLVASYSAAERGTSFSDSLVLSVLPDPQAISRFVTSLLFLSRSTAELGGYVRGAICRGLLCHEPDLCFGPALIEAYDLEQKIAVYPRIIITSAAHEAIAPVDIPVIGSLVSYFGTDVDGERFLHFLSPRAFDLVGSFRVEQMGVIRRELCRQLESCKIADSRRPKLVWLARYFNSSLAEAPVPGINPIAI